MPAEMRVLSGRRLATCHGHAGLGLHHDIIVLTMSAICATEGLEGLLENKSMRVAHRGPHKTGSPTMNKVFLSDAPSAHEAYSTFWKHQYGGKEGRRGQE